MKNYLITPRLWQEQAFMIAVRDIGTPEGDAAFVESKRYGILADEIEKQSKTIAALEKELSELRTSK